MNFHTINTFCTIQFLLDHIALQQYVLLHSRRIPNVLFGVKYFTFGAASVSSDPYAAVQCETVRIAPTSRLNKPLSCDKDSCYSTNRYAVVPREAARRTKI